MIDKTSDIDAEPRREQPQRAERWQRVPLLHRRDEPLRERNGELGLRQPDCEASLTNAAPDLESSLRSGSNAEVFSNT